MNRELPENSEEVDFFAPIGANTGTGSFVRDHDQDNNQLIGKLKVVRGDDYFRLKGIEDISVIKIDVEGYELEALKGLTRPLKALSFEFLPADVETALRCVARLEELGPYEFNLSCVETMNLIWPDWKTADDVRSLLSSLGRGDRSGDIYARLAG